MFEDLDDWQVHAVRGGLIHMSGFFPQTYPADAVTVLAACVRRKFGGDGWPEWAFHCIAHDGAGRPSRTLVYALGDTASPVRLVEDIKRPFVLQRE